MECIHHLKYGKATGLDWISTDILKVAEEPLAKIFHVLSNQVLASCVPPSDWGTAAVAVLFKTGDPLDWTNYRLISLLSIISKLFEAILNRRLTKMLNVNDLLHSFQIGCRGPAHRNAHTQNV